MSNAKKMEGESGDGLYDILFYLWGFVPSRCIAVAVKRGLFDYLYASPHAQIKDISTLFGWSERGTRALMRVLCHCGLVKQSGLGERWCLTKTSRRWLVSQSENVLGTFVARAMELQKAYMDLELILDCDSPHPEMIASTLASFGQEDKATHDFVASMDAMSSVLADNLLSVISFETSGSMLDVGCGSGIISIKIAERYKNLRCRLFDLSGVINHTQRRVDCSDVSSRILVEARNWRIGFPSEKYDVVLLSQVLHEERDEYVDRLLRDAVDCVAEGGLLLVIGFLDNHYGGILASIFEFNMLVELGSDNPGTGYLCEKASDLSLSCEGVIPLCGGRSVWIGRKYGNAC